MIINENDSVYNNIPENAVGISKELSMVELINLLDELNEKYSWMLVGYYNKFECAVNRQLVEDKRVYRDICNIVDRERAIFTDRIYYRDNK
jgi:hypothetical protein